MGRRNPTESVDHISALTFLGLVFVILFVRAGENEKEPTQRLLDLVIGHEEKTGSIPQVRSQPPYICSFFIARTLGAWPLEIWIGWSSAELPERCP